MSYLHLPSASTRSFPDLQYSALCPGSMISMTSSFRLPCPLALVWLMGGTGWRSEGEKREKLGYLFIFCSPCLPWILARVARYGHNSFLSWPQALFGFYNSINFPCPFSPSGGKEPPLGTSPWAFHYPLRFLLPSSPSVNSCFINLCSVNQSEYIFFSHELWQRHP